MWGHQSSLNHLGGTVPAIQAHNGRKHLPILFPIRFSRISGHWRGSKSRPFRRSRSIRRTLSPAESELLPVVRNVPLQPYLLTSYLGTRCFGRIILNEQPGLSSHGITVNVEVRNPGSPRRHSPTSCHLVHPSQTRRACAGYPTGVLSVGLHPPYMNWGRTDPLLDVYVPSAVSPSDG